MNYLAYESFASEQCELFCNNTCKKRNLLRNCYRPLCCGLCIKNEECEGLCRPLLEFNKEGDLK